MSEEGAPGEVSRSKGGVNTVTVSRAADRTELWLIIFGGSFKQTVSEAVLLIDAVTPGDNFVPAR